MDNSVTTSQYVRAPLRLDCFKIWPHASKLWTFILKGSAPGSVCDRHVAHCNRSSSVSRNLQKITVFGFF